MPKYTFSRLSIVDEHFIVDAATEAEALEMVQDGACETLFTEWIDWHSDDYELVDVEDELVTFLKEGAERCGITS